MNPKKNLLVAGSDEWFVVHVVTFIAIMVMIVLSYPIFGVFTDAQTGWACVFWCALWFVEGIIGLIWEWKNDWHTNTD
jgi:uncharacterized membrane protein